MNDTLPFLPCSPLLSSLLPGSLSPPLMNNTLIRHTPWSFIKLRRCSPQPHLHSHTHTHTHTPPRTHTHALLLFHLMCLPSLSLPPHPPTSPPLSLSLRPPAPPQQALALGHPG